MPSDRDIDASPPGELRHQVAADQPVKFEEKSIVERGARVRAVLYTLFERLDVAREMRG